MEELLTCKYDRCKKFYKDPIRLPCIDNSICASHLDDLYINDSKTKILCCFCNIVHQIPPEGLKKNEDLNKLLNLNAHLIKSEKHLEAKKLNLKSISIANEINEKLKESHHLLESHLNEVRQKIEDQREKCKLEIDSVADTMLTELTNYESECKLNLIKREIINERIEINESWEDELRSIKLSERRLNDLLKEMKKFIRQNQSYLANLNNDLFMGKLCEFEPASDRGDKKYEQLFFGTLKIRPLNSNNFTSKITSKMFNDALKCHLLNKQHEKPNHHVSSSSISTSSSNLIATNKAKSCYDRNENLSSNALFDVMNKLKLNKSKTTTNQQISNTPTTSSKNNIYMSRSPTVSPKLIKKSSTVNFEKYDSKSYLISPRTSRRDGPTKNARV